MHKKGWFVAMHEKNVRVRILSLVSVFLVATLFILNYSVVGRE